MRRSALLLHGRCGLRRIDFHMRDQFFRMKSMVNSRIYRIIDFLLIIKPQFHLCRMDIHIHMLAINLDVQYHKGYLCCMVKSLYASSMALDIMLLFTYLPLMK